MLTVVKALETTQQKAVWPLLRITVDVQKITKIVLIKDEMETILYSIFKETMIAGVPGLFLSARKSLTNNIIIYIILPQDRILYYLGSLWK